MLYMFIYFFFSFLNILSMSIAVNFTTQGEIDAVREIDPPNFCAQIGQNLCKT